MISGSPDLGRLDDDDPSLVRAFQRHREKRPKQFVLHLPTIE